MIQTRKLRDTVYLLQWTGEGRFNEEFVRAFNTALDTILEDKSARALITMGTGKIYSNGLDLQQLVSRPDPHLFLTNHYLQLVRRFLTLPLLTIAAVQGHAFAGGMVLALAHDYRLMRSDRGFLSMNEVLLPSTIPPGMAEVVKSRLRCPQARRECMLQGRRFTPEEAVKLGMLDGVAGVDDLVDEALKIVDAKQGTYGNRTVISNIKKALYSEACAALQIPEPAETFAHVKSKL